MKNILRIILAVTLSLSVTLTGMPVSARESFVSEKVVGEGLGVDYHSQLAIKSYMDSHLSLYSDYSAINNTFSVNPQLNAPYSEVGTVDETYMTKALWVFNTVRYIAGLDPVELDDSYNDLAQATAMVQFVRDSLGKSLSHYPEVEAGVDPTTMSLGINGSRKTNLGRGHRNLSMDIVHGWMADNSSQTNIENQGHRRWILNPSMGKTGFGVVGKNYAMYAHDNSGRGSQRNVAWPATNMPLEYFSNYTPWSVSIGKAVGDVKVTLKNENTGKTWNFAKGSDKDGALYVNNEGYGVPGCIIFNPKGASYKHGEKYTVTITGDVNLTYDVNFFDTSKVVGLEDDFSTELSKGGVPVYRLYNPKTGEHIYIAEQDEAAEFIAKGWRYEGVEFATPEYSSRPIYRMYNPNGKEWHFARNEEGKKILEDAGWKFEKIAFYSDDAKTTPLYRFYNPNEEAHNHIYARKPESCELLIKMGWNDEGIGWYGL